MLKRHWPLVLFATAIVAVGVWVVSGSQSFKSCIHDHKNDKTYGNLWFARQHLQFDCAGDAIDKHNTIVLAIATAVIAIFTVGLWISTDGLLAHGQDVERAYISGGGPINAQKTPHHHVLTIQNYGKTPGYLHHYTVVVTDLMTVQTTRPIYLNLGHRRKIFKDSISPNAPMKEICQTPIYRNIRPYRIW